MLELQFEPDGRVLEHYLASTSRVALIGGPRGSGKSTGSAWKLFNGAATMPVGPRSKLRRSRSYVIRNTYDELKRTTVETWLATFPEKDFGRFKWSKPFEHHIRIEDVDWHVMFLAMDDEADRSKLKSAEISSAWLNEFVELTRDVFDDLDPLLGRFPPKTDGGCPHPFMIGDTNPGNETHWFSVMSGQSPMPQNLSLEERRRFTKPDSWSVDIQPPGMIEIIDHKGESIGYQDNPAAENLRWLPDGYYRNMIAGKTRAWIRVNVLNRPAHLVAGKPVWPQFRAERHVANGPIEPFPGHPLLIGVDFGRTPAAVICQRVFDRWYVLDEVYATDTGARRFARLLRQRLAERFPGFRFSIWGDPAGDHMSEADEISPFLMFRAEKMPIRPAPTNDPTVRITTVEELLMQLSDAGPRLQIDPGCVLLIGAMGGGYRYPDTRTLKDAVGPLKLASEPWSHVADALQYAVIGAGEGRALLSGNAVGSATGRAFQPKPRQGIWERRAGR